MSLSFLKALSGALNLLPVPALTLGHAGGNVPNGPWIAFNIETPVLDPGWVIAVLRFMREVIAQALVS